MRSASVTIIGRKDIFFHGLVATLRASAYRIASELSIEDQLLMTGPECLPDLFIVVEQAESSGLAQKVVASLRRRSATVSIMVIAPNKSCQGTKEYRADAYLPCTISSRALLLSLDLLLCGEVTIDHPQKCIHPSGNCVAQPIKSQTPALITLSLREREILSWLARGQSNKAIAKSLAIEEATVKAHVRTVLRKTGTANRTQAAMRAHAWLMTSVTNSIHGAN